MKINEKLFAKADSLVDKILSCPHIKLPPSQTLILDVAKTGVLSDFTQPVRRKNADVPAIYFTRRCWNKFNSGFESYCQN